MIPRVTHNFINNFKDQNCSKYFSMSKPVSRAQLQGEIREFIEFIDKL